MKIPEKIFGEIKGVAYTASYFAIPKEWWRGKNINMQMP
jgi:hypothetical protein